MQTKINEDCTIFVGVPVNLYSSRLEAYIVCHLLQCFIALGKTLFETILMVVNIFFFIL